jgi:PAS domain S-box-containing protein
MDELERLWSVPAEAEPQREPRMTLARRLLLLALLSVLPAVAIWGFTEVALRREREAEVKDLAVRQARLAASELERIFQGVRGVLTAIGEMPAMQSLDAPACAAYLQSLQPKVPHLLTVGITDREGRVLCANQPLTATVNVSDRSYFREAIETGEFTIGEYTEARVSRQAVLPFAQPLRNAEGRIVGVIATSLDLRWLGRELNERALPRGGSVTIADRAGMILAREPQSERFVGTRVPESFRHLTDAAEPGALEVVSQDGVRRVLGYVPASLPPKGIYVSAGLSASTAYAAIDASARRGLVLIAAAVLLSLALAGFGARHFITRPFQAIIAGVHAWRQGAYDARIDLPRQAGELGLLAQAFNQLIADVQSREAALTESESRARLALEAGQMGAWWFDLPERKTGLSPQAARLLGLPPDRRTLGYDEWFNLLHPDDQAPTLAALELARSGSAGYETEYRVRRPEGGHRWINSRGRLLPESDWSSGRVIGIFQDVTARRQADEEQDLLLNELNHRVKNTLATVQSIAQQTLRTTSSPEDFRERFEARLLALSKTHDLLTRDAWRSADLLSLVGQEMAPYARDGEARVVVAGPTVRLPARAAINVGLVVHELATNAAKYGALSAPTGRVAARWSVADTEHGPELRFAWSEADGPPVKPPTRRGFGTRLIERSVSGELNGRVELDYRPAGFEARIAVPLAAAQLNGTSRDEGSAGAEAEGTAPSAPMHSAAS